MKTYSQLSDQEVASAIALKMGWKKFQRFWKIDEEVCYRRLECPPHFSNDFDAEIFNPCHSLDQCAVFEEWLYCKLQNYKKIMAYANRIKSTSLGCWERAIKATTDQRCEAFLKTVGVCE